MAVFVETIQLDDKTTAPAKTAASAVAALGSSTVATQGALAKVTTASTATGTAMKGVSTSTLNAASVMQVGKETISAAFTGIANAAKSLAQGDVQGAIKGVTDAVAGMAKALDLVVPGLGQAVSAVISIAGGLVGITAGLIKSGVEFAISSSEAKQQMLGLFDAMGGGVVKGAEVEAMIDNVKDKFGIAKDSLVAYTNELNRLGITDLSKVEHGILATASAAALVKGGDQAFLSLTKKIETFVQTGEKLKLPLKGLGSLADVGLTVDDVAKKMGVSATALGAALKAGTVDAAKFGEAMQDALIEKGKGPLEKFAASSANLKKLLSESFGDMFEDIDVGPFLQEIKKLFDIFSQAKPSGQAMKAGIGGFFKEVLSVLTVLVPMAKHFFLDLVIYALKAYITAKPIVATLKAIWAEHDGASKLGAALSAIVFVLKVAATVIGIVVGAFVLLFGIIAATSAAIWVTIGAIGELVSGAGAALLGWASSAASAASDFVSGLVTGISNGAGQVADAVKGLASSATSAFENALGIASPSKVMMDLGGHTGMGFAKGIEGSDDAVHGAASGIASTAKAGASNDNGSAPQGGGASIVVNVQIDGAGKSAEEITEEMVSLTFERYALAAGL